MPFSKCEKMPVMLRSPIKALASTFQRNQRKPMRENDQAIRCVTAWELRSAH